jgi:hypothetical protein
MKNDSNRTKFHYFPENVSAVWAYIQIKQFQPFQKLHQKLYIRYQCPSSKDMPSHGTVRDTLASYSSPHKGNHIALVLCDFPFFTKINSIHHGNEVNVSRTKLRKII